MVKPYVALDLFTGYGSVSKYLQKKSEWEVVSLDIVCKRNPTICSDILKWDYRKDFPIGYFDVIWASPVCTEYSRAKTRAPRNISYADRLVKKAIEIIEYFRPKIYFIENPQTGLLKTRPFMKDIPYYDVTYCKYGYEYKKPTRIWTNVRGFKPKFCKNDCSMMVPGTKKHMSHLGKSDISTTPWKSSTHIPIKNQYSIPPRLISALFTAAIHTMTDQL